MNELLISGLDDATIQRFQRRAEAHGRTVQDEIKHILTWGVDYIERIQTLTAGMKPMEKPKPFDYAAHDEALKEARAFRERIRKDQEEYERGLPEREAEEKEWEEEKRKISYEPPSPEPE